MGSNITDLTQAYVDSNGGSRDLNSKNVNAFLQQLQTGGSYDPAAMYGKAMASWDQSPADAAAALKPATDRIASDAGQYADQATQVFGKSMMDLAAQQSLEGRQSLENRFAQGGTFGTDSGAARAALIQASMSPYAQADAQVAQTRSQDYMSYLTPQAQMAAQNYYGKGDRYAALGNNYLGALSGLSQQAYVAPQFQSSPDTSSKLMDFGTSLLGSYLGRK